MPYLDTALAFAVTMLAVSTVVTTILKLLDWIVHNLLELLKKGLSYRCQTFQKMLDDFFDKELTNILQQQMNLTKADAEMTGDLALKQIFALIDDKKSPTELSNTDLIDKLKQTDIGKRLLADFGSRASEVLGEISRRYAVIEKKYSEIFRNHARIYGTIVAFVLALYCNIDTITIAKTYLSNPALTAKVAAKREEILAIQQAQLAADTPKPGKDVDQVLNEKVAALQADIQKLLSGDFPIGWSYYPKDATPWKTKSWWVWIGGIVLTGALAGLGAPFWHDVIRSLTQVKQSISSTNATTATPPPGSGPGPVVTGVLPSGTGVLLVGTGAPPASSGAAPVNPGVNTTITITPAPGPDPVTPPGKPKG